jgi:hypothetical protein
MLFHLSLALIAHFAEYNGDKLPLSNSQAKW